MTANQADGKAGAVSPEGGPNGLQADARPIVAFDFDGTLTARDSFNAFLVWRTTPWRLALGLVAMSPALLAYLIRRDRGRLKGQAVRVFLHGLTRDELSIQAGAFAEMAASSLLRPDALARWAEHRRQGVRLVIVTASPELLVAPFARRLGADDLFGTRLAVDGDGRLTGELDGSNCRGEEKVRRLREAFGPDVQLLSAYGDTAGDREMLALAKTAGMGVFSGRPGA